MIGSYSVSAIGTAHLEKEGGVCQDYSAVKHLPDNIIVAAIADGLGSAERSDIGAKLAVNSVLDYISSNIRTVPCSEYSGLIKQAYVKAYNATLLAAKENGIDARDYNTTLTVAIYCGTDLYYGQCGDGGIIALTVQGEYVRVTSTEKGESFNETHPLLNGEQYWSFDKFKGQVCAFAMMTDGIFDLVCSPLLKDQPCPIYVSFIRRFLDRNILAANNKADFEKLQAQISDFISSEKFSSDYNISDDKTFVGVINTEIMPALKNKEYYAKPDWEALHNNMTQRIYNVSLDDVSEKTEELEAVITNEHNKSVPAKNDEYKDDQKPSKYQRQKIIELENTIARDRERIRIKDKRLMFFGVVILAQLLIIIIMAFILIFGNSSSSADKKSANLKPTVSSVSQKSNSSEIDDSKTTTKTTIKPKTTIESAQVTQKTSESEQLNNTQTEASTTAEIQLPKQSEQQTTSHNEDDGNIQWKYGINKQTDKQQLNKPY